MLFVFESIAIGLSLATSNLFYLFNFTYIGGFIALGLALYTNQYRYARLVVQLGVGLYMLVYLGLLCHENMQIEGFWYYLFLGVFEAATIHYAVAKIFGPLLFGRGWCGYAWLDGNDLRSVAVQTTRETAQTIWIYSVSCLCRLVGVCGSAVRAGRAESGTHNVLEFSDRQCDLLCRWYSACISF